jgi:type II secretory pathway component PulF
MNRLKKILFMNLTPPAKGRSGTRPDLSQMWFVRFWHGLVPGGRKKKTGTLHEDYRPGAYYRRKGHGWHGPFYIVNRTWRKELLQVMNELSAIVRTNAPLAKGLEAAAREENRINSTLSGQRIGAFLKAMFFACVVIGIGIYFGVVWDILDLPRYRTVLPVPWYGMLYFLGICIIGLLPAVLLYRQSGRKEAVLLTLRDKLRNGASLADGMRQLRRFFPRYYADVTGAGEESGRFAESLDQLSDDALDMIRVAKTLYLNFVYLFIILTVQTLLITFLFIKVVPVFAEILDEFGSEPPRITGMMIHFIDFTANWPAAPWRLLLLPGLPVLLLVLILAVLHGRRRRSITTRFIAMPLLLIPWVRGLFIRHNMSIICRVTDRLLRAGLPLHTALERAASMELHPVYQKAASRMARLIEQGTPFAEAAEKAGRIAPMPRSFRSMAAVGEHAGMLPQALRRLAELYHQEVTNRTRILSDTTLPLIVLLLGFVTLIVELSVFTMLTSMVDSLNTIPY